MARLAPLLLLAPGSLVAQPEPAALPAACFTPQMRLAFWSRLHLLLELPPAGAAVDRAVLASLDRAQAQVAAASLARRSPRWHEYLPTCPRRRPEGSHDWVQDRDPSVPCFHPTAAACYRSRLLYPSARAEGHQQQCCYDAAGALAVPAGPDDTSAAARAAGTPDFAGVVALPAPAATTAARSARERDAAALERAYGEAKATAPHVRIDVLPYLAFGGDVAVYHRYWPPNRGPIRVAPGAAADAGIELLPGDVVLLETVEGVGPPALSVAKIGAPAPERLTFRGSACIAAKTPGRLALAVDSTDASAFVAWRRLPGANQCRTPVLWVS